MDHSRSRQESASGGSQSHWALLAAQILDLERAVVGDLVLEMMNSLELLSGSALGGSDEVPGHLLFWGRQSNPQTAYILIPRT